MSVNKYLIEGIDRLGKDTLIQGILDSAGYHQVLHFTKPLVLTRYEQSLAAMSPSEIKRQAQQTYQELSFRTMFSLLRDAAYSNIICNRAHLGECVYAPLYRGYSGEYVFELEQVFGLATNQNVKLVLLTEDFTIARHFVDDNESLGAIAFRELEQNLFLAAFEKSCIPNKRIISVTDGGLGGFKPKAQVLAEALA